MRTAAAQNVTEVIDGATHPELIPDDRAYHLVLMLASARPDEPVEARARADAVLNAILRGYKADTVPLAEIANRHADTYRRAAAELGAAIDERAFEQQRRDLVIESRRQIAARLSPLSAIALQFYVDREKRGMKMHRLPDMPQHQASVFERFFAPAVVHAQMSPWGTTYSNSSFSGTTLYVTGVTDTAASCSCHRSRASVTIRAPAGQAFNTSGVGGAYAQTTAIYTFGDADITDGEIIIEIEFYSFCPLINYPFINNAREIQRNPLVIVWAYYYRVPPTAEHYRRCNPTGGLCDNTIAVTGTNRPLYALIRAAEIRIRDTEACVGTITDVVDRCYSPDPRP